MSALVGQEEVYTCTNDLTKWKWRDRSDRCTDETVGGYKWVPHAEWIDDQWTVQSEMSPRPNGSTWMPGCGWIPDAWLRNCKRGCLEAKFDQQSELDWTVDSDYIPASWIRKRCPGKPYPHWTPHSEWIPDYWVTKSSASRGPALSEWFPGCGWISSSWLKSDTGSQCVKVVKKQWLSASRLLGNPSSKGRRNATLYEWRPDTGFAGPPPDELPDRRGSDQDWVPGIGWIPESWRELKVFAIPVADQSILPATAVKADWTDEFNGHFSLELPRFTATTENTTTEKPTTTSTTTTTTSTTTASTSTAAPKSTKPSATTTITTATKGSEDKSGTIHYKSMADLDPYRLNKVPQLYTEYGRWCVAHPKGDVQTLRLYKGKYLRYDTWNCHRVLNPVIGGTGRPPPQAYTQEGLRCRYATRMYSETVAGWFCDEALDLERERRKDSIYADMCHTKPTGAFIMNGKITRCQDHLTRLANYPGELVRPDGALPQCSVDTQASWFDDLRAELLRPRYKRNAELPSNEKLEIDLFQSSGRPAGRRGGARTGFRSDGAEPIEQTSTAPSSMLNSLMTAGLFGIAAGSSLQGEFGGVNGTDSIQPR